MGGGFSSGMKNIPLVMMSMCLLLAAPVKAQVDEFILDSLRVVEDPDGNTNLRSGPSLKSKIVGQVASGSVVAVEQEPEDGWVRLLMEDSEEKPRFIHGSRLRPVKAWRQTAIADTKDRRLGVLNDAGFEVRVLAAPFVAADHQITRDEQGGHRVDGEWPWGRDGGLPSFSLSLTVTQSGEAVTLPKAAVQNLYEPNMSSITLLRSDVAGGPVLVLMLNGDGAGGYCVVWAFQGGRYRGRAVFTPF